MGAWDGFYSLGGTEIANEERFRSYIQNVAPWLPMPDRSLDKYEGLHLALGDPAYSNPTDDRAPWVDLDDPVSADFLGFTVLSVEGLEDSKSTASATESLGKGGSVGYSRETTREIRVTGLLVGLSQEAVQQGFTWLNKVLWQGQNPRPLVPQMPGVSDLRFFAQQPDVSQDVVNRVLNPSATGLGESLVGSDGTAYAFRSLDESGNWAYKMLTRTAGNAEVQLIPSQRALAVPGSLWVARVDVWRAAAVSGQRYLNVMLRFRDQYGNVILSVGKDDVATPEGVLYRWTGVRFDSPSQMLTPTGMTTNWIINPAAEGTNSMGLITYPGNRTVVKTTSTTAMTGKRAYLITAGSTGTQSAASRPIPVEAGQQWWGRARGKQTSASGARHYRPYLEWLDSKGTRVDITAGTKVDLVPAGSTHKWLGARFNSVSQEVTGDTVRYNRNPNPIPRTSLAGYSTAGPGTAMALERYTGLGTPWVIRVTTGTTNANAFGLNIPSKAVVGETIYVTFWIIGSESTMRLQGDGFTFVNSPGTSAGAGLAFTTSTSAPTRISIPIVITKATQVIRIIPNTHATKKTFRVTRIGLLTGSDLYFDGDTGTFEWEGTPYQSSSIGHLAGNYDLYNTPWNPGFEKDTYRWSAGAGMTQAWAKSVQRLGLTVTTARASGNVLTSQQQWPYISAGQRIGAGMKVYNNSATAFSAAVRVVASGGTIFDGTTTTVPANGSAWLPLPQVTMPSGTSGAVIGLVAKGTIAVGTSIHVDSVFLGTVTTGTTVTEAMWFDGATAKTNGPAYVSSVFDFAVGGVAPEGAVAVRLMLTRMNQGPVLATDALLVDQVMLAQYDAVDSAPDNPDSDPTPTMPAYFDGDYPSTYQTIPTYVVDSSDSTVDNAVVTAAAPEGAVTAEIAVQRAGQSGAPVAGDVFYLDNVMLAQYDPEDDVPDFTSFTRHDLVSETERWVQDVYPIAGPTPIQDIDMDCQGYATQVEFTVVAENPTWLRDNGDTVALPLPTSTTVGGTGLGTFALIEDRNGIVKNYMPQFSISSPLIPNSWVVSANSGAAPTSVGYQANSASLYALKITQPNTTAVPQVVITAQSVLGDRGGYASATASIWLGGSTAGKLITVQVTTMNGGSDVATTSATFNVPDTSSDILNAAHRLDIPITSVNGAADGFRFTVIGQANYGNLYVSNPQVTLGSAVFPPINGNLPDDGTYTYDFDAAGFSRRTPVKNVRSHTIFANLTAPPIPVAGLGGYDEVGLTTYRTYAAIPAEIVPRNADAVPVMRFDFDAYITRWVRVRFYPNPQNVDPDDIDTSTFTAEWVIDLTYGHIANYNTQNAGYTSVVVDGVARRVWLRAMDGTVIPGDQFVMTSEGSPIDWPEFRDIPWVVSVEYPTFKQANEPSGEGWWRASLALMIEE